MFKEFKDGINYVVFSDLKVGGVLSIICKKIHYVNCSTNCSKMKNTCVISKLSLFLKGELR